MDFSNFAAAAAKSSPSAAADDEFTGLRDQHLIQTTTPSRPTLTIDTSAHLMNFNTNSNSGYATPTYEGNTTCPTAGGGGSGGGGGGGTPGGTSGCCKSLKHFKKSMIVEYESSHVGEDSQSSSSSSSSSASSSSSSSTSASHLSFKSAASSTLQSTAAGAGATKPAVASSQAPATSKSNSKPSTSSDAKKSSSSSSSKTKQRAPEAKKPSTNDQQAAKSKPDSTKKSTTSNKHSDSSKSSSKDKSSKNSSGGGGGGTSKSKQLYCICKSADTLRFMIACDKCDEWYHGDCVGVTQTLSKKIKTFFCHLCRHRSPGLKIRYKRKFQKFLKSLHKNPSKKESLLAKGEIYARFYKETRVREKKEALLNQNLSGGGGASSSGKEKDKSKKSNKNSMDPGQAAAKQSQAGVKREPADTAASTSATSAGNNRNTSFDALLSTTESLLNLENSAAAAGDSAIKNQHFGKSNVSGEDIENFFSALTKLGSDVIQMNAAASAAAVTEYKPAFEPANTAEADVKKRADGDKSSKKSSSKRAKPHDGFDDRASRTTGESPKKARRSSSSSLLSTASSLSSSSSSSGKKATTSGASDLDSSSDSESEAETTTAAADGRDNYETDSYDRTKHDDSDDSSDLTSSSDDSSDDDDDDESDESSARKRGDHTKKDELVKRSKKPGSKPIGSQKNVKSSKKSSNGGGGKPSGGKSSASNADKQKRRYTMTNRRPGAQGSGADSTSTSKGQRSTSDQPTSKKQQQPATQCLGPGCINAAAESSKYCSDQCGLALARERLLVFLEPHLAEYQKLPCYSDAHNQTQLAKVNTEIQALRQKLVELEARHVDLDKLIEKAKSAKVDPNVEREQEKLFENNEIEVSCVSCGHTFSERHAFKHMEKCFNKIESQAFFGSFYKTHIDGQSMFCDYYNPQTKMYCKRLKVMCPEHEKEKKISENEVCGCPLPKSEKNIIVADDNTNSSSQADKICLASKRSCPLHVKWEKVKRAQIDLEKLRTWLKLEELLEKKRFNEISLNQRGSLLSLLLHQTLVHQNENGDDSQQQSSTAAVSMATPEIANQA